MSIQNSLQHPHELPLQPAAATSRFIEVDGLRLHYLDYGAAGLPPMLCVHGGGAHAHWFDFMAQDFSRRYHVRALDLRGHGDSAWAQPPNYSYGRFAADLAEFADKLDLRDFVLIGHSMGGMISLVYAAMYPGRMAKLVIVDSMLQMNEERIKGLRDVGQRGRTYPSREEFISRYRLRPGGKHTSPPIVRHMAEYAGTQLEDGTWRHKLDRTVYATREAIDGLPCFNQIAVPALIVKGALSGRITPELFAAVKTRCPQIEVAEVAGANHHVMLDNPAGFTQAVEAFLDGGLHAAARREPTTNHQPRTT